MFSPHSVYPIHLVLPLFLLPPSTLGDNFPTTPLFKRFEYIYSFKGPYLAQPDGSIPFWERRGNALPHDSNIRVTPSLRNQRGAVWTKNKTTFDAWEVDLVFRISGRGKTGGDGMAFWFVDDKPDDGVTGSVFGGHDGPWKGMGLFWDSYDNDGNFNNPAVIAVNNHGSTFYDHDKDGHGQYFANCKKDFRNKLFYTRARITYHKDTLSLYMTNGRTKDTSDAEFEPCFYVMSTSLPKYGYFGVSAATGGGVADDHDVSKFLTFSIRTTTQETTEDEDDPETEKIDKEFQDWQQKLDKKKEEYMLEHPDVKEKHNDDDHDPEDEVDPEDEIGKEMSEIFEEQSVTRITINKLTRTLDEMLGKEVAIMAAVTQYYTSIVKQGNASLLLTEPSTSEGTPLMQRHEVDNLLTANQELLTFTEEIRVAIQLIDKKLKETEGRQDSTDFPGVPSPNQIKEVTNEVEAIQIGLKSIVSKMMEPADCSSIFCISTKNFVLFNAISTLLILAFLIYKDNIGTSPRMANRFY